HWLDAYFLKLTYSIEKQVMIQIHNSFNVLFQEWFSMLIDDEQITSRIDDSFTPVIEQNGYEISFINLSGGEKTSAALAYRLALNRVINDVVHEIKTKDLLILDEPTDGFSSDQLDKVRDVLERLDLKQTIIVSHESKIESFVDNVIRIGKDNVSRVV
ncbi:MAG: SMC family ATPase, partial [Candidatus Woesearchaeota archaeon]